MRELESGDYPVFGPLIWCRELIGLTLLLLTDFEAILLSWELGDQCMVYSYVVITPSCHPPKCIRPSRPGRIGGRDWA